MVDLQVVAFPQDGAAPRPRSRGPGRARRSSSARTSWAASRGSRHTDAEAREHVRRMCALAAAHGRRVAMLVDDAGDPALRTTEMLAEAMLEHGLVGRGVANHARAVGLYARPSLERLRGPGRARRPRASSATRTPVRCTCPCAS